MDHDEIVKLTYDYGNDWAINHAKRLLHLVDVIADGKEYNREAAWLAAYLHDWGGYAKWQVAGVEHYDRSREVAEEFLTERNCPEDLKTLVLEIIACHHGGSPDRSFESKLFTDADAIDLLGVIGTMRICCMVPRNLGGAVAAVRKYRELEVNAISFERTRQLAASRIAETDQMLRKFEEESFGMY